MGIININKVNHMTSIKLQSVGKKVFGTGFIGSCITSFLIYVGSKEAPFNELIPYYIAHLILFILMCVGCWMVLEGKKQKLGLMWILLLVPYVNLFVLKRVFDLKDNNIAN